MTWSIDTVNKQPDRLAIVTGANSGLGFDTALALAKLDMTVVLACRNQAKGDASKAHIIEATGNQKIHCLSVDLSSLASVKEFAQQFNQQFSQLDLLINNAGIMMPPYAVSVDGFESQLAANYLGHFLLTGLLLPLLEKTQGSRIVSLSSLAHQSGEIFLEDMNFTDGKDYTPIKAYGQTKLACLMFAFELQRRLSANNCQTLSVAAHPGVSGTNLDQHLNKFSALIFKVFSQSAVKGTLPTLYAALGEDILGGDYCGPDGMFGFRGNPTKVKAKPHAYDTEVAKNLWALSEEMTGIQYYFNQSV